MNQVNIVAVIVVEDRKLLLVRKANARRFMLPGGKREPVRNVILPRLLERNQVSTPC